MPDGRSESPRDLVPGFASLLKRTRKKKDWSIRDLAKASGVAATSIYCIEREWRSPSLRVAKALAEALGLGTPLADPAGTKRVRA